MLRFPRRAFFRRALVAGGVASALGAGLTQCSADKSTPPTSFGADDDAVSSSTTSFDGPGPTSAGGMINGDFRMNLAGYVPGGPVRVYFMANDVWADARVSTSIDNGSPTLKVGADLGPWNNQFRHVYPIDLDGLSLAPSSQVSLLVIDGSSMAATTSFVNVASDAVDFAINQVSNAALFFEAQRDGADVITTILSRMPSHLADETATVYEPPTYQTKSDGSEVLQGALVATGETMDASGGWFDAGDYLKFVETTSYAVIPMLLVARDANEAGLIMPSGDEAKFGLEWLAKMYDDASGRLAYQVGIGDGNDDVLGDHDVWRLPEADDALDVSPGDASYYLKYRPVFAAPAGKISPNLAGRLAAAFALGSQVYRFDDVAFADACLLAAEHVLANADTAPSGELLTTSPYDYYPEVEWRDDLELGAAEIAVALSDPSVDTTGLPESDPQVYVKQAAHWASAYIAAPDDGKSTLDLYDVSALGHAELFRASGGGFTGLEVSRDDVLGDLRAQLEPAKAHADADVFGVGVDLTDGDVVPRLFGLAVTARLYDKLAVTADYETFATRQMDYVLGANPWNRAFVVMPSVGPSCLQHQIANLVGSLDVNGTPLLVGAVVDGPSAKSDFTDLGTPLDGARPCSEFVATYDSPTVRFVDDVVAWPSVEPALDYTAISVLAFAQIAEIADE